MKPFFSIIIPTLNEERFLPRLLKCLQNQKEQDFEIIVVDGSSEDETKAKALEFRRYVPIAFYEVKKRNVSFQRNYGATKAKGSYLVFLDADCTIGIVFTKKLKDFILKRGGLVFLPYVDPEENTPQVKAFYQFMNFLLELSQVAGRPFSSVGCAIFERHFFHAIGGYDEAIFIGEDHSIIQKAQRWGVRAKFMPHIKIRFSFRRVKKEGKLKSIYKLIVGTAYTFFQGDVKRKIFEYQMGGHLYNNFNQRFTKKKRRYTIKEIESFFKQH